MLEIKH